MITMFSDFINAFVAVFFCFYLFLQGGQQR